MRFISFVVFIFAIISFNFAAYRAYKSEIRPTSFDKLQIVKACDCITEVTDLNNSQNTVPNQDKQIYKSLREAKSHIENLKNDVSVPTHDSNNSNISNTLHNTKKARSDKGSDTLDSTNSVQEEILQILKKRQQLSHDHKDRKSTTKNEQHDPFDTINTTDLNSLR